jgi:glycosyltransferase involved in cell wall biosynthesis
MPLAMRGPALSEPSLAERLARHAPADPAWEVTFLTRIAEQRQAGTEEYAKALADHLQSPAASSVLLERIGKAIADHAGLRTAINTVDRCQLLLGLRKPRIAIYDHTWQFIGGAQKYGATMAEALQDLGEITLIGNRPFSSGHLSDWYRLDLKDCAVRVVPLPFFEEKGGDYIDPAEIISRTMANPFHAVSRATLDYDLFINNSTLEMVLPLAHRSALITHFPERRARSYFYVDRYDRVVCNSHYTAGWIEKRWGLKPQALIYPPVDMMGPRPENKEPVILSAARFDPGGNKQQLDMIRAFQTLIRRHPKAGRGWRLILAGGSHGDNPYLRQAQRFLAARPDLPVELRVNITAAELQELYRRASLFWHFCGLEQSDPALVEHFGMTVAEAMQSGCVPLVFDGGGMREIVRSGENGYLFSSLAELFDATVRLFDKRELRAGLAGAAWIAGRSFAKEIFAGRVRALVQELLAPAP